MSKTINLFCETDFFRFIYESQTYVLWVTEHGAFYIVDENNVETDINYQDALLIVMFALDSINTTKMSTITVGDACTAVISACELLLYLADVFDLNVDIPNANHIPYLLGIFDMINNEYYLDCYNGIVSNSNNVHIL